MHRARLEAVLRNDLLPPPYMLNMRGGGIHYGILFIFACFMNTVPLNVYIPMPYAGLTRRNTLFVFVWLRPKNT